MLRTSSGIIIASSPATTASSAAMEIRIASALAARCVPFVGACPFCENSFCSFSRSQLYSGDSR